MNKRYQIFISSTFEDLKPERVKVAHALQKINTIPVGMEHFSAGDEEQWKVIARHIDQSDYYVVIIAHRYGSMTPEGISYTEKEYDYALSRGVPISGLLIADNAMRSPKFCDSDRGILEKLVAFKKKVKIKPVDFWTDGDTLAAAVMASLHNSIRDIPRPGWIRASNEPESDTALSNLMLTAENEMLRKQLEPFDEKETLAKRMQRQVEPLLFIDAQNNSIEREGNLLALFMSLCIGLKTAHQGVISTRDIGFVWATNFCPAKTELKGLSMPINWIARVMFDLESLDLVVSSEGDWWLTQQGAEFAKFVSRRKFLKDQL